MAEPGQLPYAYYHNLAQECPLKWGNFKQDLRRPLAHSRNTVQEIKLLLKWAHVRLNFCIHSLNGLIKEL